jgi:hypothetical protein
MPVRGEQVEAPKKVAPAKGKSTTETKVTEGAGNVTYSITITKNLDNYESLKIQAGLTVPMGTTDAELAEMDVMLVKAREKVIERLTTDLDSLTSTLKK